MKLAARPKFVLHGAMMRNGVYGARRAPFYTVSKYYNSGGDTAGRDSIKISICFNGARRYGVMDLTLGAKCLGNRLLFQRCAFEFYTYGFNQACVQSNEIFWHPERVII